MRLTINSSAPDFDKTDVFDRKIELAEYRGKKILLAFFRHAGCPFCNLRVHNLMKHTEDLKRSNLEMVFVFESMKRIILRSSFHREISPVPLLADPEKELYNAYGLEKSSLKSTLSHLKSYLPTALEAKKVGVPNHYMSGDESFSSLPAEFLIDVDGIIRELHYSDSLTDRMQVEEIYAFAK